ncbi:MAG: hypothetical protein LBK07_00765 [Tannerella sp.]|nr:hypothetical protein [Tannerella sp.]
MMKTNVFQSSAVCMMLCLGMISCTQMNDMEMPAGKKTGFVNTVRKEGVEFRFSMLNERGEPANVFREGENFSFYFEMENLRKGDEREYYMGLYCTLSDMAGLGKIYTPDNELVCSIRSRIMCAAALISYPFYGEEKFTMRVSLQDAFDMKTYLPLNITLPKGSYSAGFTHIFDYRLNPDVKAGIEPNT